MDDDGDRDTVWRGGDGVNRRNGFVDTGRADLTAAAFEAMRKRLFKLTLLAIVPMGCSSSLRLAPNDADVVLAQQLLDAPNPAEPGQYEVRTLYYGSGTDRRRPEYRDSITIRTDPVDARKLVDLGRQAKERNGYWGFDPSAFPLNGRVWYPEGPGPFPLVLIAHGNHNMREFSDPGYGYLGKLLASRGFIMTSVDMNFVNGGIREENDARGWLFLKHLEAWREFTGSQGNPFYRKVDMDKIAVIGHSRGGEAVGHAAAFNRLSHYPDDATLKFDFNFGIQSVIAIAPVDGQYLPTGRHVPVQNVNYMVFHGSHDGDVTSFHGLRLYHRIRFTDGVPRFKTAIYVYRANHGQWNTVWGSGDIGGRSGRILNLGALMDAEDQRQFAKIYIPAFLEATLKGDKRYLPIFRDHRVIGGWLPKTMYITRFQTSTFRALATFEEDIDVTSGTKQGVTLRGDHLTTWREGRLLLRSRNRSTTSKSQENQAVWLGWDDRSEGEEEREGENTPGSYAVTLPDSLGDEMNLSSSTSLDFLLAPTGPTRGSRDDQQPIDLTVELVDAAGARAQLAISRYGVVRRPLGIRIMRRGDQERFPENYDLMLQTYSLPLGDFLLVTPRLDLSRLTTIRFVFDRVASGTVVVDDIGFSELDPAFTSVTVGW